MSVASIYRILLKIFGGLHLFVGLGFLAVMTGTGPYRFGYLYALVLLLVGLVLLSRSLSPRVLTHPRSFLAGCAAIVTIAALAAASFFAGGFLGGLLEARGMENARVYGLVPSLAMLGFLGTQVMSVLVFLTTREERRAEVAAIEAATGQPAPLNRYRPTREQARRIEAAAPPDSRGTRALVALDWLVRLVVGGAAAAAFGAAVHLVQTDRALLDTVLFAGRKAGGLYAAATALAVYFANPIRVQGDFCIRPRNLRQAIAGRGLLAVPLALGAAYVGTKMLDLGYYPNVAPFAPRLWTVAMALAGTLVVLGILIARSGPSYDELIVIAGLAAAAPVPARATGSAPAPRPVPDGSGKLPAIGAMMKLYVAADWLVLRLIGVGLCGTAWMLWTLIDAGKTAQADLLALGQDPMIAVYVYGGIGAILAVPFLLPQAVATPRHVFGGLLKAIVLVGSALALISPMRVAVLNFTPEVYHLTLLATVPTLFKAITGVAVTSTLLIAFFRQLGTSQRTNYRGEPVVMLSADDLRQWRAARMGGRSPS